MARPRGFSRSSVARAPRRRTEWSLGPGGDDIATLDAATASASVNSVFGSGVIPLVGGLTITRIRGFVQLSLESATAAGDGYQYGLGIGIVTSDAFTVGITAIPKPFTDADWGGWLWHHIGAINAPIAGGAGAVPLDNTRIEIDTKAMRKWSLNESLFLVGEFGETGTAVITFMGATRMLVKLA